MVNRKVKNWCLNCIRFYYQRWIKNRFLGREESIWVFSAWEGMKYEDNARFLYEYVNEYAPHIRCVWMTKNREICEKLEAKGYKVCRIGTAQAKRLQERAKVAVYTNGLDDFGDFPYVYGACLVSLWHGAPLKKNYATKRLHKSRFLNRLSEYKARVFSYIYRDITIASSPYVAAVLKRESLTKNPIYVAGQPRNDILKRRMRAGDVLGENFKSRCGLEEEGRRFLLYMPTYRGSREGKKALERAIREMVESPQLNLLLSRSHLTMLIKTHYLTSMENLSSNPNFIFLADGDVECVQKLLCMAELLITDYSSCAVDFALTGREILFFTPDFEEYRRENGLYSAFIRLTQSCRITEAEELTRRILESTERGFISGGISGAINGLYNETEEETGNFSGQVLDVIQKYAFRLRR